MIFIEGVSSIFFIPQRSITFFDAVLLSAQRAIISGNLSLSKPYSITALTASVQ